jgi:DNA-binding IclR family transcriptional regulator
VARPSPQTDRVIAVVRLLSAHPEEGFSISEIARRLQLHKATCYPMIGALADSGWLDRDPVTKLYRLGPALIAVGEAAGRSVPATAWARPAMLELSERFGVTCAAFARTAGDGATEQATLADQVWDVRSTVPPLRIGQRIPLRAPFGAAFVAWADEHTVDAWTAGTDEQHRRRYTHALAAIRDRGFAVELRTAPEERLRADFPGQNVPDDGVAPTVAAVEQLVDELADEPEFLPLRFEPGRAYAVSTLNAPVFDRTGGVCLGLTLLGFGSSLDAERLAETGRDLRRAADTVTKALAAGQ